MSSKRKQGRRSSSKKAAKKQPDKVERYSVKPEFWDMVFDNLPSWSDEIVAIMLMVFGILSFLSLLNISSDATISNAWANALTGLFGYGSVLVAAGIFSLGVAIFLPKIKEQKLIQNLPTRRILALEIAFLALLAIMHLSVGDAELRAIARAGRGGGQIGWALSVPFGAIPGSLGLYAGLIIYAFVFLISAGIMAGMQRSHVITALKLSSQRLRNFGEHTTRIAEEKRLQRRQRRSIARQAKATTGPDGKSNTTQNPILRVRPNLANLPPSQRPGAQPRILPPAAENQGDDATTEPAPLSPQELEQHPLFTRREDETNLSAIGKIKKKKLKGRQLIERPDGRIKRYFTVGGMKEAKKVGKRPDPFPALNLLQDVEINLPSESEINNNVVLIENTLLEFDIDVDVVDVRVGPTVTQYALQPFKEHETAEGEKVFTRTRMRKIASLSSDLALSLSAKRLRLETPVPGENYMGVEVPNKHPSVVALRSVYESRTHYDALQKKKTPLLIPLGRDVAGVPISIDLATLPHILIAGTTGSGKSASLAAITTALVLDNLPDIVKLILLDPKMVEFSRFNGLPHLLGPVETDQERIIGVLRWCTREMDRRYKLLEERAARNIEIYNSRLGRRRKNEQLPYIAILVDEIGDMMLSHPDETERSVTRLAQMARAVGMHLVLATQRPSTEILTGLIKANFPARIAFAVASGVDSRVILDSNGAETLLGKGDMLYLAPDAGAPRRLQGCFVSDDEVRDVVNHWRAWHEGQIASGKMQRQRSSPWERGLTRRELLSETDPMLEEAIELVIAEGEASASLIQRRMGLGYPRAARIVDLMQELGVVGAPEAGGRSRKVLIKPGQDPFKAAIDERAQGHY